MAVRILTDSAADLPQKIVESYGVPVVANTVYLGDKEYADGVDLDVATFYQVAGSGVTTKTANPNPAAYQAVFERLTAEGDEVVYICLSSGLSGSIQSATIGRDMLKHPELVHIVDSLGASMGEGLMAMQALDLATQGVKAAELVPAVEAYRDRLYHIFTLNTLSFAVRSGRVSAVSALAAGLLDIKPVLHMPIDGRISSLDKTRGRKKALRMMLDVMEAKGRHLQGQRIGISHAVCEQDALELAQTIKDEFGVGEVVISTIGPTVGAHVGPGTLALFFEGEAGRP